MENPELALQLSIINGKLDLLIATMPKLKQEIKKESITPIGDGLKAKYRRAVQKLYRVPSPGESGEQLKYNDQIREEISKHIGQTIPDKHQTWLGRIFSSEGYSGGIVKVDGKTKRGYYVVANS